MKVGDYVRTEYGIIDKITRIVDFEKENQKKYLNYSTALVLTNDEKNDVTGSRGEIIKSSPNIIDLIEVGDYVNSCPVLHKENNELVCGFLLRYKGKDIKAVVTKEQFSQTEYRIGE